MNSGRTVGVEGNCEHGFCVVLKKGRGRPLTVNVFREREADVRPVWRASEEMECQVWLSSEYRKVGQNGDRVRTLKRNECCVACKLNGDREYERYRLHEWGYVRCWLRDVQGETGWSEAEGKGKRKVGACWAQNFREKMPTRVNKWEKGRTKEVMKTDKARFGEKGVSWKYADLFKYWRQWMFVLGKENECLRERT